MELMKKAWAKYIAFMHKYGKSEAEMWLWLLAACCAVIGFISVDLLTAIVSAFTGYILPKYGVAIFSWYMEKRKDYEY